MTRILYGLGRVCVRFRWLVLLVWLAALVGIGGLAQQLGDATNDNYSLPGTGSQQASDVLNRLFPEQENGTSPIVLHARNGGSMAEGGELEQTLRSAYEALPPGGALVAIEALIDDARRENVQGLLMSLNMLIEFGDAFDYSGEDFRRWCREVGFTRFEVIHLAGPSSARRS